MPATSEQADKLADELQQVGTILGFESSREAPVLEGSTYRVDILWRMSIPKDSPFPPANIASIEIQCSNSPTSISHNILKAEPTLHPSYHIVVSFNELQDDYRKILRKNYPGAGLVILDGESNIRALKRWIDSILENRDEAPRLAETGKKFFVFVNERAQKGSKHSRKNEVYLDHENWFDPTVFKMDIEATLTKTGDTFENTYFLTGTIEKARRRLVDAFEEDMSDMPLEWEGQYASLRKVKITCYQICGEDETEKVINGNAVFKIAITAKVGIGDAYFQTTHCGFGENAEETERRLLEDLRKGVDRMKSLPRRIFDQQVYTATYSKITSWEEKIDEEVLVLSKDTMPVKEQKEKIRLYFSKEFGLELEELVSIDGEIDSRNRYFENFGAVKDRLREVFEEEPDSFRRRMYNDDYRKLEDWLLRDDSHEF
jgi:hypothetical protein